MLSAEGVSIARAPSASYPFRSPASGGYMLLPMIELLFMLFAAGLAVGLILMLVPTWRRRAPLALEPVP